MWPPARSRSIARNALAVTFLLCLCALSPARALAGHIELCPGARGSLYPVQDSAQLYGLDVIAPTARTLEGVLAFDTDRGWYTASFAPVPLQLSPRYRRNVSGWRHDYGVYSTGVLRVEFPENVTINNWWLFEASSTSDDLGWSRRGVVRCPADIPERLVRPENRILLDDSVASQFERPVAPSDTILHAVSVDPIEPAPACAVPFQDAAVKMRPLPRLSSDATFTDPAWVTIEIVIPPDGHVTQSAVYISSGSQRFDAALQQWIADSQFSPKIVYCHAVTSIYQYQIHTIH